MHTLSSFPLSLSCYVPDVIEIIIVYINHAVLAKVRATCHHCEVYGWVGGGIE